MRSGIRLKGIKVTRKANGRRYIYRRVGSQLVPLPDLPENHPEFLRAYAEAGTVKPRNRRAAGSIAALCADYLSSRDFKRLKSSTQAVWRRTIEKIAVERGAGLVRDLQPQHLRKDIRRLSPGAASNRLKAWRSLLKFAVEEGMIHVDPSHGIRAQKGEVKPHRQWTPEEIATFRDYWPIDTAQRQAFEVIYWTGARCIDAARLGSQMVDRTGWLHFTQEKTGGPVAIPVNCALPAWAADLADDQRHLIACLPTDRIQWIVTQTGKPRSVKGLSQWMSAAASKAGLPDDCTAHGLRKARAARLAEIGASAHQIGAWTGHESLSEVSHYTRAADKKTILGGGNKPGKVETVERNFWKPPEKNA